MKTIRLIIACFFLLMSGNIAAQDYFNITCSDVEIAPGGTANLVLSMENSINVAGWQVFLYLPEGVSLVYDEEKEDYIYELSSRHNKKHQLQIMQAKDGSWMLVMTGGAKNYEMTGNNNEI